MDDAASATRDRDLRRRRRIRRAGSPAATLMTCALLAAGCSSASSSMGVASGATTSPSASAAPAASGNALLYSRCMRSHGVTKFPDPNSQGQIQITGGIDPNSPQYQSAQNACKSLQPGAGAAQQAKFLAAALKFARCMRAHGLTHFPDPNANGGLEVGPSSGIDPNSPQYQSAQKACQHYMAGLPGGGTTTTHTGSGGS